MQRNSKKHIPFLTRLLIAVLLVGANYAQSQNSPPAISTAAECQTLLQLIQANAHAGGTQPLTPAQIETMAHCLATQGQVAASSALPGTPSQNLLQGVLPLDTPNPLPGATLSSSQIPTPVSPTAQAPLGPKRLGVIRIGVVQPKAQMGQGNSGANVAEPIRGMLSQYLNGPTQEIVPLSAMLSSQIDAEAKAKECDYVLFSTISQKLGGGGAANFLKKAGPMTSMIPVVGMAGGVSGAVAGAVTGTAVSSAANVASTVKAKSEITLEYKLMIPGNDVPVLANTEKAKAKEDGEDIISPLMEQAATAIVAELTKKR